MRRKLVGANYQSWLRVHQQVNIGQRLALQSDSLPLMWPEDPAVLKIQLTMRTVLIYKSLMTSKRQNYKI